MSNELTEYTYVVKVHTYGEVADDIQTEIEELLAVKRDEAEGDGEFSVVYVLEAHRKAVDVAVAGQWFKDQRVVDEITGLLADPEWSVEYLEWIADMVGQVRPHPGGYETRGAYREVWRRQYDRDLPGGSYRFEDEDVEDDDEDSE